VRSYRGFGKECKPTGVGVRSTEGHFAAIFRMLGSAVEAKGQISGSVIHGSLTKDPRTECVVQ